MNYIIHDFDKNVILSVNKSFENDTEKFLRYLKTSLKRKFHITLIDVFLNLNFCLNRCNFCNNYVMPTDIVFSIQNISSDLSEIIFEHVKYKNDKFRFCKESGCYGKKLNANSLEFVKKAYSFDTNDEALNYIHKRNSSPFYKENHLSIDEYKKYQSRDKIWYKAHNKNYDEYIKKANYHKSLEYKIKKYGTELDIELYNNSCKAKSLSSKEILSKRYNNDINKINLCRKKFIILSSHNLVDDNIFSSIDILCNYIIKKYISLYNLYTITIEYIKKYIVSIKLVEVAFENCGYTQEQFINYFYNYCLNYNQCAFLSKNQVHIVKPFTYGALFKTNENKILRSSFERDFYYEMCKFNLNKQEYYTDLLYPNQFKTKYRYDFYFPKINVYVEIAGMINKFDYNQRLQEKIKLFNPIVIYTKNDIISNIQKIKHMFEEKSYE